MLTVTTPRSDDDALLVPLADVKTVLEISADDEDAFLTDLITRCSGVAEDYCRRIFAIETVQEVLRLEPARDRIQLERSPVTEIVSISIDGTTLASGDYEVDKRFGTIYRLSADDERIPWEPGKTVISYKTGFETIPAGVRNAIIEFVTLGRAARTRDPSLKSENVLEGLYSYTLFAPTDYKAGMPMSVAEMLDPYVRLNR